MTAMLLTIIEVVLVLLGPYCAGKILLATIVELPSNTIGFDWCLAFWGTGFSLLSVVFGIGCAAYYMTIANAKLVRKYIG